ncbi:MAG: DUF4386 family protein [Pseudomonadota bacterium]
MVTFNLQKIGGMAALVEALAYIAGFAVMFTVFMPPNADTLGAGEKLAFMLGKQGVFQAWNLFIYVVFGVLLVLLSLALHERLEKREEALTRTATAFGLIWAGLVIAAGMIAITGLAAAARLHAINPEQATTLWQTVSAVQEGIGGGIELVGGLWVILVSWSALRQSAFPRLLNYLGIALGLAGVLTIIPALKELGALFGLGQIAWFAWLGVVMLKAAPGTHA